MRLNHLNSIHFSRVRGGRQEREGGERREERKRESEREKRGS